MAQGFVRSNNFSESNRGSLDRSILDNLGGANITDDILLFDGNTKFTSRLAATDYSVDSDENSDTYGLITIIAEGRVPFSEGTILSHDDTIFNLTVVNSNALNAFEIRTSTDEVFIPTGKLQRNDTVTSLNLSNLSVKRLETNSTSTSGISVDDSGSIDLFNDISINNQVAYIQEKIGLLYYKAGRVPVTYRPSVFSLPVTFNGPLRIVNDAATVNTIPDGTTPGIFMVNVSDPNSTPIRAFADSSNPWEKVGVAGAAGSSLTTEIQYSQVNVLKLTASAYNTVSVTENTNLDSVDNDHYVSETITTSTFTHKLPIMVNGQQYYLLLKS